MPIFIIETTAESSIREFWQVEAETAEQARDKFEAGQVGTAFLWDEVQGDETEREVAQVHPRADLAGTIALHNAQQEAPAMLAALRNLLPLWSSGIDEPWVRGARAILSRIDGAPSAQPATPSGEAAPVQTFTAFCQEADGTGTIWIQQVKAETIADATAAARRDCAENWGFDVEQVHCLGLAQGDCRIVHWQDLCDGEEG